MYNLTILAGVAALGLATGLVLQPPELRVLPESAEAETQRAVWPDTDADLMTWPVVDGSGLAEGQIVQVFRLPDGQVAALQIRWPAPDLPDGFVIEHPVEALTLHPDRHRIDAGQSWLVLHAGYLQATTERSVERPGTGT
jgi:hypothetical protein